MLVTFVHMMLQTELKSVETEVSSDCVANELQHGCQRVCYTAWKPCERGAVLKLSYYSRVVLTQLLFIHAWRGVPVRWLLGPNGWKQTPTLTSATILWQVALSSHRACCTYKISQTHIVQPEGMQSCMLDHLEHVKHFLCNSSHECSSLC